MVHSQTRHASSHRPRRSLVCSATSSLGASGALSIQSSSARTKQLYAEAYCSSSQQTKFAVISICNRVPNRKGFNTNPLFAHLVPLFINMATYFSGDDLQSAGKARDPKAHRGGAALDRGIAEKTLGLLRGEKRFAAAQIYRVGSADNSAPFIHPSIRVLKTRHSIYGIVYLGLEKDSSFICASPQNSGRSNRSILKRIACR